MTEQETVLLIETEQRCKSNTHRIDNLDRRFLQYLVVANHHIKLIYNYLRHE